MFDAFENRIGYHFQRPGLLETALTHSSYANENRGLPHNERLEFLGDAVLDLCSAHYLFGHFPAEAEGALSKHQAALVCEASLAECARQIGLDRELLLGKGEEKSGGRCRDSLLSDAFEAVIGAIYLDGGFEPARDFIDRFVMEPMAAKPVLFDAKTQLQELLQADGEVEISYRVLEEAGPDHEKSFTASVNMNGEQLGTGSGSSKKQAEQAAAAAALKYLREKTERIPLSSGSIYVSEKDRNTGL